MAACLEEYGGGPNFNGKLTQKGSTALADFSSHHSSGPSWGCGEVTRDGGGGLLSSSNSVARDRNT